MLTDLDRNTLIENRESAICLIFTVNLTFMTGFLSNDAIFFLFSFSFFFPLAVASKFPSRKMAPNRYLPVCR